MTFNHSATPATEQPVSIEAGAVTLDGLLGEVDDPSGIVVYAHGSGIPFYGRRQTRFLYIVTDTFRDGVAAPGFWNTALLSPGDYILRVWAADIRGNAAVNNRDVAVTIAPPAR